MILRDAAPDIPTILSPATRPFDPSTMLRSKLLDLTRYRRAFRFEPSRELRASGDEGQDERGKKNFSFIKLCSILLALFLSGCNAPYRIRCAPRPQTPVFVAMPINDCAVEPIGQLLYSVLVQQLQQRGYELANTPDRGYVLCTSVLSLAATQHFISQDVVLLDKLMELNVTCRLYNFRNELVKEKFFTFETIVPKTQTPLQQDAYTSYYLRSMLEHHVQSIEQTLRPYLQ